MYEQGQKVVAIGLDGTLSAFNGDIGTIEQVGVIGTTNEYLVRFENGNAIWLFEGNMSGLSKRFWQLNNMLDAALYLSRDERRAIRQEMKALADELDAIEDREAGKGGQDG